MLAEAVVIGILAGGWASATYWQGESGVWVGITAGLAAWFVLVVRNESKREKQRQKRSARKGVFYELHR